LLIAHKVKKDPFRKVTLCSTIFLSFGQDYNWRNYQPSQMSESELQMLASLRRQQNEELEDMGAPHGLSASQVDNCNVSISTSSDDTTTWNSCLPPVSAVFCIHFIAIKPSLVWEN
jgi:hypothetical protein